MFLLGVAGLAHSDCQEHFVAPAFLSARFMHGVTPGREIIANGESAMLPHIVSCEECGERATVRGYGRVEYEWDQTGDISTLQFKVVRLTIDCPRCGVRVQEHRPAEHEGSIGGVTSMISK